MVNRVDDVETTNSAYKSLYRLGGAAALVVVVLIVLCCCCVLATLTLAGPAVGNVFSNIIEESEMTPMP